MRMQASEQWPMRPQHKQESHFSRSDLLFRTKYFLCTSSRHNDRRGIAAITISGRRARLQFLTILRERHLPGVGPICAVPSAPTEYGDRISGEHRLVLLPANPV